MFSVLIAAAYFLTPVCYPTVVNHYPHDVQSFTQGLVFQGQFFYESTGLYGQSSVKKVSMDGRVLHSKSFTSDLFAEGLALLGEHLFQLTWRENVVTKYDLALNEIERFHLPVREGWGLTTFNNQLVLSDGSNNLYFIEPSNFKIQRVLAVLDKQKPIMRLNELEVVNGYILANVWLTHKIAVISPVSGQVLYWLDLIKLTRQVRQDDMDVDNVLNGIAFNQNSNTLFVTGKRWETMFEISLCNLH